MTGSHRGISDTTQPPGIDLIMGGTDVAGRITATRGSTANSTSIVTRVHVAVDKY